MSLATIWNDVLKFLHLIKDEGEKALHIANQVVNKILAFETTPLGHELESIIEGLLPTELKSAFILWLPQLFKGLKWAEDELNKSDEAIVTDGLTYFKALDGDFKAVQANTLAASISKFVSDNTGGGLTIQQSLVAAQPVHQPELSLTV